MSEVLHLDVGHVKSVNNQIGLSRVTQLDLLHEHTSVRLIDVVDDEAIGAIGAVDLDLTKRRVARPLQPHDRTSTAAGPAKHAAVAVTDELMSLAGIVSVSDTS